MGKEKNEKYCGRMKREECGAYTYGSYKESNDFLLHHSKRESFIFSLF
jgi:hypothetical protein